MSFSTRPIIPHRQTVFYRVNRLQYTRQLIVSDLFFPDEVVNAAWRAWTTRLYLSSRTWRPQKKKLLPGALVTKHLHVGRFNRPRRSASRLQRCTKIFFGSMAWSCTGGAVQDAAHLLSDNSPLPCLAILCFGHNCRCKKAAEAEDSDIIHVWHGRSTLRSVRNKVNTTSIICWAFPGEEGNHTKHC